MTERINNYLSFFILLAVINFLVLPSGLFSGLALRFGMQFGTLTSLGYFFTSALILIVPLLTSGIYISRIRSVMICTLPFLLYPFLSILWSENIIEVIGKSLTTATALMICATIIMAKRENIALRAVYVFSLAVFIISFSLYFLGYGTRLTVLNGHVSEMVVGIFDHKAVLADICAVLFFFGLYFRLSKNKSQGTLLILASCIGLLLAQHWTTTFACGVVLFAHIFPRLIKPAVLLVTIVSIALPFAYTQTASVEFLLSIMDRNVSLSGRTYIWEEGIRQFQLSPILGNGYFNIRDTLAWIDLPYFSRHELATPTAHSHNMWIEILFMFGVSGLLAAFFTLCLMPILGLNRNFKSDRVLLYGFLFFATMSSMEVIAFSLRLQSFAFYFLTILTLSIIYSRNISKHRVPRHLIEPQGRDQKRDKYRKTEKRFGCQSGSGPINLLGAASAE